MPIPIPTPQPLQQQTSQWSLPAVKLSDKERHNNALAILKLLCGFGPLQAHLPVLLKAK